MCGIYGMFSLVGAPLRHPDVLAAMKTAVHHRGPDGSGLIATPTAALGVERLRIVDPRDRADQPFATSDRDVWLAGNGEIYNHRRLRAAHGRYPYRSTSDIEAALPLFSESPDSLADLEGKFALVAWRNSTRELTLMRDRAGENPLFFALLDGEIAVASEIQALLLHPSITREIDEAAVSQFFTHGYVIEPRTMFAAIRRVAAGTITTISRAGMRTHRYWDPRPSGRGTTGPGRPAHRLDRLLRTAVGQQLTPGVTTGVFCSGGIDSSLLAALVTRHRGAGVPTFAVRFTAPGYDESRHAADLATTLGTEHHEIVADDESLCSAFGDLARLAEPVSDPALLPTILLAREASRGLKVVLSGEGADELFGGYPTYHGHQLAAGYNRIPARLGRLFNTLVERLPASHGRVPAEFMLKRFVRSAGLPWIDRHAAWFGPGSADLLARPIPTMVDYGRTAGPGDEINEAMLLDYHTYLRDQLLVKFDRATMMHALEARCPYLDRAVTEFACDLPRELKVRGMTTKWLLKQVAASYLPPRLVHRRKQGLSVPIADLLNRALQAETDRLLLSPALQAHGLLRTGILERMLSEHRNGTANHARALWTAVTFQLWYERWALGESQ